MRRSYKQEGFRIAYRGPDGPAGHVSEREIMLLDGEIDNAAALARKAGLLLEPTASSATAAAVLLQGFGTAVLPGLEGRFALAFVQIGDRRVHLARDRFGRRPLSFASIGSGWAWGSEIKSLVGLLPVLALEREALSEIYHYRWLVDETTPVAGIRHVPPGAHVTLELGRPPAVQCYWTLAFQPDREPGPRQWDDRTDAALGLCPEVFIRQFLEAPP